MGLFLLIIYWNQEGSASIITGDADPYLSDHDGGYDSEDAEKVLEARFHRDKIRKDTMLNRYGSGYNIDNSIDSSAFSSFHEPGSSSFRAPNSFM